MRILASNPDTIGDVVLRQPLYRALREAGHELTLVVRPSVLPIMPYVAPGAGTLVLPAEVYRDDLESQWGLFGELFRAAREWRPDVLLVAPFRWTKFEEKLADELRDVPGLRRVGMSGRLYAGDPHAGREPASRLTLDVIAGVDEDLPEAEKNAALAAAVLGRPVEAIGPVDPRIEPDAGEVEGAKEVLGRLGLEPGGYWLACVTGTVNVPIKAWPAGEWAKVLGEWAVRHGRRFLLVGLPEERPVAEEVRSLMGDRADRAAVWMEPGGTLGQLVALASLSNGYVGHDTGPMHVAAAVGKPVLAVFGGGHKLRFLPRAAPSVSLTVGVACAGCEWVCSFDRSYCVKAVPADEVLRAAEDLEAGRVHGREARVIEPDAALLNRMVHQSARLAQLRLREAAELSKQVGELAPAAALLGEQMASTDAARAELNAELDRVSREAAGLSAQLQQREAAVVDLRAKVADAARAAERLQTEAAAARAKAADVEPLREQVRRLEQQLKASEAAPRPRRPWRQVLAEWVIGSRHYTPRRAVGPMPKLTLAVPIDDAPEAAARATLDTVLAQHYPHLDLVVTRGCAGDAPEFLTEYEGRVTRTVCNPGGRFAAIAKAFESSDADAVGWLDAGDVLEPGALLRAGEFFRDHATAAAVYFDDTEMIDGWHVPTRRPRLGVYALLAMEGPPRVTAFFRRREYELLGPLDPTKRLAAGWDLLIRFARRYGLRRGRGHGVCRGVAPVVVQAFQPASHVVVQAFQPAFAEERAGKPALQPTEEQAEARQSFLLTFGPAGRLRCRAIDAFHRVADALGRSRRHVRLTFPLARGDKPLPPVAPVQPTDAPAVPLSFLTARPPDRLLFSTPEMTSTGAGPRPVYQFYYDEAGDAALAHPPVPPAELERLYAARDAAAGAPVTPPDERFASPYGGYTGGRAWERLLLRLPSPYWKFRKPPGQDAAADRAIGMLRGLVAPDDAGVRVLDVGCYEGLLLDRVGALTKWQPAGTESNPRAAAVARGKGHTVWQTTPHDAAMAIPVGESFDVLILTGVVERLPDPVAVLRRLRQLLVPGGYVVLSQPSLDSKMLDLFGPAWARWRAPYHRTLTGPPRPAPPRPIRRLPRRAGQNVHRPLPRRPQRRRRRIRPRRRHSARRAAPRRSRPPGCQGRRVGEDAVGLAGAGGLPVRGAEDVTGHHCG